MIDFHCHVDLFPDPKALITEAVRRECYILAVTTTPLAWEGTNRVIGDAPRIRIALGLHPELVAQRQHEVEEFRSLLPAARYVGEIGLDGSRKHSNSRELQRRVFRQLLRATADAGGRIMSIHSRRAASVVLDELADHPSAGIPVLHWFSGTLREASRAVKLGCWFSVGPAMLRSQKGQRLLGEMPKERVLTESDGPFGQLRGQPIVPWSLYEAIKVMCGVWQMGAEDVRMQLRDNLRTLVSSGEFT